MPHRTGKVAEVDRCDYTDGVVGKFALFTVQNSGYAHDSPADGSGYGQGVAGGGEKEKCHAGDLFPGSCDVESHDGTCEISGCARAEDVGADRFANSAE